MSNYGKMWILLPSLSKKKAIVHIHIGLFFVYDKSNSVFTLFEGSSTCLLFLGEKLCNVNTFIKKNIVTNSMNFGKEFVKFWRIFFKV